jgi:hypothetical protein
MGKRVKAIQAEYVRNNYEALLAAKVRADNCDTTNTTLGEGLRRKVLAATGFETVDEMLDSAEVVYVSKRAMIVNIGILQYVFGKFGVPICVVPSGYGVNVFAYVEGPSLLSWDYKGMLKRLGAVEEFYDRGDYVHNYLGCKENMCSAA